MSASPAEPSAFARHQYELTAHIRDPQANPAPAGVEDRRLSIYRELFYNNVESLIAGAFPVLRGLFGDEAWHRLMRDFFAHHQSHTPLFPQVAQEFLQFLEQERRSHDDPPFLLQLAHYEWVEMALSIDTREIGEVACAPEGDLLDERPVISPLAWSLAYDFPVHRISPEFVPAEAGEPSYIVVYRGRDDRVGFLEMNPVTARLLNLLNGDEPLSGRAALERIAAEMQHSNPGAVIEGGLQVLEDLRARDIVLGTVPVDS